EVEEAKAKRQACRQAPSRCIDTGRRGGVGTSNQRVTHRCHRVRLKRRHVVTSNEDVEELFLAKSPIRRPEDSNRQDHPRLDNAPPQPTQVTASVEFSLMADKSI